ncbi:MAG: hypothetical protein IPF98_05590 [Gemmatimonadetes bacterium]|nr:hypothetical protein [Gemmatimonadota bacterium]
MVPFRSRSTSNRGDRTARDSPASVPLWREAIRVEKELRPAVTKQEAARDDRVPYVRLVASAMLTGGAAVVGGVYLYRDGLVRARLDRSPQLQGRAIVPLPRLLRLPIVQASWQLSAMSLAGALAVWLLVFALPRTRRAALRWAIIPLAVGAAAALYGQWWYARFA